MVRILRDADFRDEVTGQFNLLSESPLLLSGLESSLSHSFAGSAASPIELCRFRWWRAIRQRKSVCTSRPESSTPMEIALKSIAIDFDALCAHVVSANIERYQSSGTNDICRDTRDTIRYLLRRNVIVSSLRFLNSSRNKTHLRHQDDLVTQTYRRALVNTSFAYRKLQFDALTFCTSYSTIHM